MIPEHRDYIHYMKIQNNPAAPLAGYAAIYPGTDYRMYTKDSNDVEYVINPNQYPTTSSNPIYYKGYVMGGYVSGGADQTTIEDINFNTSTSAAISAVLPVAKSAGAGLSSPNDGWRCCSWTSNTVERLSFPNEACYSFTASLPTERRESACPGGNRTHGYLIGGVVSATIDRFTYLSEIFELTGVAATYKHPRGFYGSSIYKIYFTLGGGSISTGIYSLTLSDETVATCTSTMDVSDKYGGASCDNTTTKARWFNGKSSGGSPTYYTTVNDFTFSSEVRTLLTSVVGTSRSLSTGISSRTKGYATGGLNGSTLYTIIDETDFLIDHMAVSSMTLDAAKADQNGVQCR